MYVLYVSVNLGGNEDDVRIMNSLRLAIDERNPEMARQAQNELLDMQVDRISQIAFNLLDLRGFDGRRLRAKDEIGSRVSLAEDELYFLLENLNSSQVNF